VNVHVLVNVNVNDPLHDEVRVGSKDTGQGLPLFGTLQVGLREFDEGRWRRRLDLLLIYQSSRLDSGSIHDLIHVLHHNERANIHSPFQNVHVHVHVHEHVYVHVGQ